MRYYIIYNGQQHGPLEKEQLKGYNLNYDSDVWAEGMLKHLRLLNLKYSLIVLIQNKMLKTTIIS